MELLDYKLYLFLGKDRAHIDKVKIELDKDINKRRFNSVEQADSKLTNNSYFSSRLASNLFIPNRDAFSKYCELLQEISQELFGKSDTNRLTKTEMLLFAIADAEIAESVLKYISSLVAVER